jgi:hypothetical protein
MIGFAYIKDSRGALNNKDEMGFLQINAPCERSISESRKVKNRVVGWERS